MNANILQVEALCGCAFFFILSLQLYEKKLNKKNTPGRMH